MRGSNLVLAASAALLAVAAMPSLAGAQAGSPGTPAAEETEAQISARLAATLQAEIGDRASSASAEDLEGYMMFVLSQRNYTAPVINSALDSVSTNGSDNLRQAVANIRIALLRRKANRGTAALIGSGGGFGTSNFSQPIVSTGGGSSNYTF